MNMMVSKYSLWESRSSWSGLNAWLRTSARYSMRWLKAPLVRVEVRIVTRRPTLRVRASNIRSSALVWSVEPFSYMET